MKSISWVVSAARKGLMMLGLLVAGPLAAGPALEGLDGYIEQVRKELGDVGVAVAVVQGDRVVFSKGFGLKQHGQSGGIGPDTLFQVGSTTKPFTTAALGILVDEGKIGWDDRVADHLPGFQLQDPWLTRHLTVRDAVTHRSGVRDTNHFVFRVMDADTTLDQLRYIPATHAFRDTFQYSNLMYAVAGKLIESASGQSWHEFVKQRLLTPLQMKRSGTSPYEFWGPEYVAPTFWGEPAADRFNHGDARDADVAMPHFLGSGRTPQTIAWQSYDNAAAAGSVVSSANDMANWLILHLNEGRFAGRQLLKPETVKQLHAVQNTRYRDTSPPISESTEGYAMGWFRARYRDHVYLWHGGGILGFPAYIGMLPEQKIGVVVLANSRNMAAGGDSIHDAVVWRVFDMLLGAPSRDWGKEIVEGARKSEENAHETIQAHQRSRLIDAPPSLSLERYTGEYEDKKLHSGPIQVRLEDGRLTLSFGGEGAFSGYLDPWHHDVFHLRLKMPVELGQYPSFILDQDGNVGSMSLFGSTYERTSGK